MKENTGNAGPYIPQLGEENDNGDDDQLVN